MNVPDSVGRVITDFFAQTEKADNQGGSRRRLGTPVPEECYRVAELYLEARPQRSADWGLGDGTFALTCGACRRELGLSGKHITLDPFQHTVHHGVGLKQIRLNHLEDFIEFRGDTSEKFMLGALAANELYDFILIDGGHDIGQKLVDAFFAAKVLRPGGIMLFHDSQFFSTHAAVRYLTFEVNFEPLKLSRDPTWKNLARVIRHGPKIGFRHCWQFIPLQCRSLTGFRKPLT